MVSLCNPARAHSFEEHGRGTVRPGHGRSWRRPRWMPTASTPTRLIVLAACLLVTGCGATTMPSALFGTWNGGNDVVHSVRFSSGGRVEINGSACAGSYSLSAIDGDTGTLDSGYIDCSGIMNGYFTDTATVTGGSLNLQGDVLNGTYHRA